MAQPIQALKHLKCLFRSNWSKCPWSTYGWPKVKIGQNHHTTTFFMFLHQTWATRWFSSTLTTFDPRLTLKGPENHNFDLTIRTGWNQCHRKDYRILFPTTIHGLKLESKWSRYLENCARRINSLPGAITFDPTVEFQSSLAFQKLHT